MDCIHTEQVLEGVTRTLKSFDKSLNTLASYLPLDTLIFDQPLDTLQDKIDRQMPLYIVNRFMREEIRKAEVDSPIKKKSKKEDSMDSAKGKSLSPDSDDAEFAADTAMPQTMNHGSF